jgi:hypothetical protein
MYAFDAPLHGKHISLRDFSSKYDHEISREEEIADDCQGGTVDRTLYRLFPACGASAMTFVYALRREITDWGPQAALLQFFLSVFLTLRIYSRLYVPDKTHAIWPSLVLYITVMLFAYPYEMEKASVVVFCVLLFCAGFHSIRCVQGRSLAVNAMTLMLLLNGLLCLVVSTQDNPVIDSYYHISCSSLCLLLVSF